MLQVDKRTEKQTTKFVLTGVLLHSSTSRQNKGSSFRASSTLAFAMISRDDEIIVSNSIEFHMSLSLGTSSYHCNALTWIRTASQGDKHSGHWTILSHENFNSSLLSSPLFRTWNTLLTVGTRQKRTYRSLDLPLWDRDFERLRAEALLFLLGGDSDESFFERADFFLLVDDFAVPRRVSLVEELLLFSLDVFPVLDFFDEDDVTVRSWSVDDWEDEESERCCLLCLVLWWLVFDFFFLVFFDEDTTATFDVGCCIAVLLSVPMRERERNKIIEKIKRKSENKGNKAM